MAVVISLVMMMGGGYRGKGDGKDLFQWEEGSAKVSMERMLSRLSVRDYH